MMARAWRLCPAVALLFTVLAPSAFAVPPQDNLPVEINGDRVKFSIEENKVTAEGNVSVIRDKVRLYCDKVEYDRDDKTAHALGHVVIIRDGERLTGDEMTFNVDTMKGVFTNGKFFSNPFYGAGEKIRRIDENHIVIERGYLTTSDYDKPEYRMYAKKVDVYPQKRAVARSVRLMLGNVPVFYMPKFTQDMSEKQPAVLYTPGYDKDWGAFLLTKWRYHLTENVKGNLHLDYRVRRDLAEGLDMQYKSEAFGEGIIKTYYMNERRTSSKYHLWKERLIPTVERERFKGEWRHHWNIDPQTSAIWQYYKLSDDEFLKDYFEQEYRQEDSPDTYFLLTHAFPVGNVNFLVDSRVNRFVPKVERLPEVSYNVFAHEIASSNFYIENTTTYSNLTSKAASPSEVRQETMRVDTENQLSYPFKLSVVEVRPFVGARQTYYSKTKKPEQYGSIRGVFDTGADLTTRFFRVFDVQSDFLGLDINRLRHVVSPSIAYLYRHDPTVPSSALDQYDTVDSVTRGHVLNFSIENKLQTKREGASVDLARMVVGTDFRLKEDTAKGGFQKVTADIEVNPYPWLGLYFDSEYDTKAGRLKTANVDLNLHDEDEEWYLRMSKRYHVQADDLLTTEFGLRLNPKWRLRTYQRYDLQTGSLKEQEYGIERDLHTWLMTLNFNQTRGEGSEIWLVFTLKAFPDIGLDFTTSFNKRKAGSEADNTLETPSR